MTYLQISSSHTLGARKHFTNEFSPLPNTNFMKFSLPPLYAHAKIALRGLQCLQIW